MSLWLDQKAQGDNQLQSRHQFLHFVLGSLGKGSSPGAPHLAISFWNWRGKFSYLKISYELYYYRNGGSLAFKEWL